MPVNPARIPMMTTDGVVLSRVDTVLRAAHPNATDEGDQEIEMFFDSDADADVLLDERWNWKKTAGRIHEAVEVDASFGFGTLIAVAPTVPNLTVQDSSRSLNVVAKVRAFAADYTIERHSIELLG